MRLPARRSKGHRMPRRRSAPVAEVLHRAVLWSLIAGVVIAGAVIGWLNADGGEYRDAVVLDTWTEQDCGWHGPAEHQTYSCTTSSWASVSYWDNGREQTGTVAGTFAAGERTEIYIGRFNLALSWGDAFAPWLFFGVVAAFIVWCINGVFFD